MAAGSVEGHTWVAGTFGGTASRFVCTGGFAGLIFMSAPPMLWFMIRDVWKSVEGEVAKWFAVDFCKTRLVTWKTMEKDIDECPSIHGQQNIPSC